MKILMKSLYLYILGAYAEYSLHRLNLLIERSLAKTGTICAPNLVYRSDKCYKLFKKFGECERVLLKDFDMRRLRLSE